MGVALIVEVLDGAPQHLTPSQRLTLVVLAEKANDQTRVGWPGTDVLKHRTGLKDRALRDAIAGLKKAGVLEPIAVGTDRNGDPMYAYRGRAAAYRIPRLQGREKAAVQRHLSAEKDDGEPPPSEGNGGSLAPERRQSRAGKAAAHRRPPLSNPQMNPQVRARDDDERSAVQGALFDRTGRTIDDEHADAVARQILAASSGAIRAPVRYLRRAIEQDPDPGRFLPTPTPPRYVRHA